MMAVYLKLHFEKELKISLKKSVLSKTSSFHLLSIKALMCNDCLTSSIKAKYGILFPCDLTSLCWLLNMHNTHCWSSSPGLVIIQSKYTDLEYRNKACSLWKYKLYLQARVSQRSWQSLMPSGCADIDNISYMNYERGRWFSW